MEPEGTHSFYPCLYQPDGEETFRAIRDLSRGPMAPALSEPGDVLDYDRAESERTAPDAGYDMVSRDNGYRGTEPNTQSFSFDGLWAAKKQQVDHHLSAAERTSELGQALQYFQTSPSLNKGNAIKYPNGSSTTIYKAPILDSMPTEHVQQSDVNGSKIMLAIHVARPKRPATYLGVYILPMERPVAPAHTAKIRHMECTVIWLSSRGHIRPTTLPITSIATPIARHANGEVTPRRFFNRDGTSVHLAQGSAMTTEADLLRQLARDTTCFQLFDLYVDTGTIACRLRQYYSADLMSAKASSTTTRDDKVFAFSEGMYRLASLCLRARQELAAQDGARPTTPSTAKTSPRFGRNLAPSVAELLLELIASLEWLVSVYHAIAIGTSYGKVCVLPPESQAENNKRFNLWQSLPPGKMTNVYLISLLPAQPHWQDVETSVLMRMGQARTTFTEFWQTSLVELWRKCFGTFDSTSRSDFILSHRQVWRICSFCSIDTDFAILLFCDVT
ncbi:hypothetical protein ACCO45_009866 [Purpureocillium lilacinum]|uniref:Uncharacterized protein n=1 Tax=Purpureocillium lilacinum TaxID=33203 RepID=A0ACC4DJ15_PURLI